ncbi:MAG: TonB-dependent receptor [Bacteroidetes bacterium]|nr:TonB-dependent receptor [Bacteroidota bacterium]
MKTAIIQKFILLATILAFTLNVHADNRLTGASVSGIVKDSKTGEQIPFITVLIKNTVIGTTTDANGKFTLKNIPVGKITVQAQGVGYKTVSSELQSIKGKATQIELQTEEDAIHLNEVVVSSNRNETNRKDASIVVGVISPRTFEVSNAVCLAQGLNFQPGLRVESDCQNCGFQQVRMNGLEGPYSQILLDSRPIFSALSSVYGIEQIPVNMVERVEVVRGGGSALYGSNAIAGTINIITKDPQTNSYSISHNLSMVGGKKADNTTNVNTSIVSDDRKMGMYLYGSYRDRQAYDDNGDGFSEVPIIKNNSFGFRSYIHTSDYSKLTFEYHNMHEFRRGGNKFDLQPDKTDITEQIEHYINGGGLGYNWFTPDGKNKINAYASLQHINRNSYYGAGQDPNAYGKTTDLTYVIGSQYVHDFDKLLFMPASFTTGAEYQFDELNDKMPGYNRDIDQTTKIAGFFAQNEWKTKKISLLAGARIDKHNLIDHAIISPRFNIKYNIADNLQSRLSYASGFRAPQAFDEDLHVAAVGGQVMLIHLANDLKPERSHSFSGSLDYYLNIGKVQTNLMVEAFYTRLNNVFVLQETGTDDAGNLTEERRNGPGANVQGINIEGKLVPSRIFNLQLGYTIQRSNYLKPQAWSDDASVTPVKRMLRSPNSYGYFTFEVEPSKSLSVSCTGTYTGSMLAPHFAGYIASDELKVTPDFFDAGIKASYKFFINSMNLQLNAGVQNILNSYQSDFDKGSLRDSGYIYGPSLPKSYFIGIKLSNL